MVFLMLRNGQTKELGACADIVHRAGYVLCLDKGGKPVATFTDDELLYYTLNPASIQTLRKMKGLEEGERAGRGEGPLSPAPRRRLRDRLRDSF